MMMQMEMVLVILWSSRWGLIQQKLEVFRDLQLLRVAEIWNPSYLLLKAYLALLAAPKKRYAEPLARPLSSS